MQWRPFAGKLEGVGVPQPVGVDPLFDAGLPRQPGEQRADVGRRDAAALERTEDRGMAVDADSGPAVQPELDDCPRPGVQADNAVAVALAVKTRTVLAWASRSFGISANASLTRKPARYKTTIKPRLRTPVAARFEQARIRAFTSSAVSGSGGSLRPLLAGTWSMLVEIMVAVLKVVSSCASHKKRFLFRHCLAIRLKSSRSATELRRWAVFQTGQIGMETVRVYTPLWRMVPVGIEEGPGWWRAKNGP